MGLKSLHFSAIVVLVAVGSGVSAISLNTGPKDTDARPGDTVQLDCDVDYPKGRSILWYHGSRSVFLTHDRQVYDTLDGGLRRRLSVTGSSLFNVFNLVISDVQPEDDGYYYCGYRADRFAVLGSARLTVLEPPSPESPSCDFAWLPGSNSTGNLTCAWTGGRPAPTATWYRDGAPMAAAGEGGDGFARTRLELTPDDNGAAFACGLASRAMDEGERFCTVSPLRVPPTVDVSPALGLAPLGSTAEFRCRAAGLTAVRSYTWRASGGRDLPRGARTLDGGRLLRLPDVRAEDDGLRVTCRAEISRRLAAEATAVLRVVPARTTAAAATTTTTVAAARVTPAEPTALTDSETASQTRLPLADDPSPARPGESITTMTMTTTMKTGPGLAPPSDASLSGTSPPVSVVVAAVAGAAVSVVVLVVVLVACVRRSRAATAKGPLSRDTSIQLVNSTYETVVEGGRIADDPVLLSQPGYQVLVSGPDRASPSRGVTAAGVAAGPRHDAYNPGRNRSESPRQYTPRRDNNSEKPEQELYANVPIEDEATAAAAGGEAVGSRRAIREPTYVNHGPAGAREEPDPRHFNAEGLTYAELDLDASGRRVPARKNQTLYAKLK